MSFSGSEKELVRTIRSGKKINGEIAYLKYLRNNSKSSRFAVITPKTVAPSAVVRNRIRRIFKEAFRSIATSLPAGADIVVFPNRKSIGKSYREARSFFEESFGVQK